MKTVIEMAREAGKEFGLESMPFHPVLERFAELVRADAIADEREALGKLDWTAIMREGGLVTWGDAEELGDRVLDILRNRSNT